MARTRSTKGKATAKTLGKLTNWLKKSRRRSRNIKSRPVSRTSSVTSSYSSCSIITNNYMTSIEEIMNEQSIESSSAGSSILELQPPEFQPEGPPRRSLREDEKDESRNTVKRKNGFRKVKNLFSLFRRKQFRDDSIPGTERQSNRTSVRSPKVQIKPPYINKHIHSPNRQKEIVLVRKMKQYSSGWPRGSSGVSCVPVHRTERLDLSCPDKETTDTWKGTSSVGISTSTNPIQGNKGVLFPEFSLRRDSTQDNAFLLFGGDNHGQRSSSLQCFNFRSQSWEQINPREELNLSAELIASPSFDTSGGQAEWPTARAWQRALHVPQVNKLFVFGGYNGNHLNDMYELDLNSVRWSKVPYHCTTSIDDIPGPRNDFSFVIREEPFSGDIQLVVFAGYSSERHVNDMFTFNVRTYTWRKIYGDGQTNVKSEGWSPLERSGHTAAMNQKLDRMIVYGGYGNKNGVSYYLGAYLEEYRFDIGKWFTIHPNGKHHPPRRRGHGMVPYPADPDNMFVVFGGRGAHMGYLNDLNIFVYNEQRWINVDLEEFNFRAQPSFPLGGYGHIRRFGRNTLLPSARHDIQMFSLANCHTRNAVPTGRGVMKLIVYGGIGRTYLNEMHQFDWLATKFQFQTDLYEIILYQKSAFTDCDIICVSE